MNSFVEFALRNKVVTFHPEPIKLASGRMSNFYVNWRSICEDVFLFEELIEQIMIALQRLELSPDCIYGVPEGGTKLGLFLQYIHARSRPDYFPGHYVLSMGRGKPKERGPEQHRHYLGIPRGKVLLIEDVATTGDSILQTIERLKLLDAVTVTDVLVLTDREEIRDDGRTVRQAIEAQGARFHALSNARALRSN